MEKNVLFPHKNTNVCFQSRPFIYTKMEKNVLFPHKDTNVCFQSRPFMSLLLIPNGYSPEPLNPQLTHMLASTLCEHLSTSLKLCTFKFSLIVN